MFRATELPSRKPDFVSKSGSQYWFLDQGVIRHSNHWGRAAKCKWRLVYSDSAVREKTGYANWSDFQRDNDFEKLYFISVDDSNANYFHKDSGEYAGEFLRTASETVKRLRQIRTFLDDSGVESPVNSEILKLLISSDKPLWQIRSAVADNS